MTKARTVSRDTVRIGTMTLRISKEQKQAGKFYELLFGLCDRLLPGCGCDLVLLPERSALQPADRQPIDGPHFQRFAALAKRLGIYLIAPLVEADGKSTYNTHATISPKGELVNAYRKIHLAPGEEKTTQPGKAFTAFDLPWFKAGVMICFDNHFPESSRCLTLAGARVLFWPAFGNLARPGLDSARCIDNGVYVVTSGVVDMACDISAEAFNRGAITNPAGDVVALGPAADCLTVADLPLDPATGKLASFRFDPNYLDRRMPGAYAPLVD